MEKLGVKATGIKIPLIQSGDNLLEIIKSTVVGLQKENEICLNDGDILGITESVVARAQGNYATIYNIADDVSAKIGNDSIAIVFPILSRNRFSNILKGLSLNAKKVYIQLSYPSDEVGNHFVSKMDIFKSGINPYKDSFTEAEFRDKFENITHEFTGVDYISLYKEIVGDKCEVILSNDPSYCLKYTKNIIVSSIHDRFVDREKILYADKNANVIMLDEILNTKNNSHGYSEYGLLGCNYVDDTRIKLFPRECNSFCNKLQNELSKVLNKKIAIMVYGDGAFKDPVGKIWELADPVVSPGHTKELIGLPNEIKLKSFIDNAKNQDNKELLLKEINDKITNKNNNLIGNDASLGTTPRRLTDLLGSLCDLVSGSGDRGTPLILIQNYFKNYTN